MLLPVPAHWQAGLLRLNGRAVTLIPSPLALSHVFKISGGHILLILSLEKWYG